MIKTVQKTIKIGVSMALCLTLAATAALSGAACSECVWFGNKMSGGVGSYGNHLRYYWIAPSAQGDKAHITKARDNWVRTTSTLVTSIDLGLTTVQKNSVFDILKEPVQGNPTAITYFYDENNQEMPTPWKDWKWTEIVLNPTPFNALSTNRNGINDKVGTVAHEFGHCFGLMHRSDNSSIMQQLGAGRNTEKPNYIDLRTINHIYG